MPAVVAAAVFVAVAYAAPSGSSAAQVNTALPTISGHDARERPAIDGRSRHTWTGDQPIVFTYQWLRCNPGGNNCVAIPTAFDQTYIVQAADVGNTLRVRVTATNATGPTTATSDNTAAVAQGPPARRRTPSSR